MTKKELSNVVYLLGVLSALGPFSIDMYLPGFPAIARDLNTSIAEVGYSLTSYFIGISAGQLLYGPIIDRFGRKIPLIAGLVIYIIAALLCAVAPSIEWLIGLRALLALGGCAGMVAGRAIVRDLFPPSEIAAVIATLMLIMGVAPLIAPSTGGWVVSVLGWQAIFVCLAIICFAMLLGVYFMLPESRGPDKSVNLAPSAVMKGYWVVVKQPAFIIYGLAGGFTLGSLFAYISGSPFIYMEKFNFTQTQYGFLLSVNSFGYIAGSQLNRFLLRRSTSLKIAETTSLIVAVLGFVMVITATLPGFPPYLMLVLLFLCLFGSGLLSPNTMALALAPFSTHAGSASALIGFTQMLFGALASGLVSLLHDQTALPMTGVMALCALASATLILIQKIIEKRRPVALQNQG